MARNLSVKKGDLVQVISGKDKGLTGRVIATYAEKERVLVEGVNRITRHTKVTSSARGSQQGGIVIQEAPIHVSNVMIVDPKDNKPTRVGFRRDTVEKRRSDGTTYTAERSVRISRRSGEEI